jgi:hypothetical protein
VGKTINSKASVLSLSQESFRRRALGVVCRVANIMGRKTVARRFPIGVPTWLNLNGRVVSSILPATN